MDGAVGVMSWASPGIAVSSLCMLRPPIAPLPDVDEPAAPAPASGAELNDVEVVGLDRAPATGVVIVEDAFVGAVTIGAIGFTTAVAESLLWSKVPSTEVGAGLKPADEDGVLGPSTNAVASGGDFLISLWGLRTDA